MQNRHIKPLCETVTANPSCDTVTVVKLLNERVTVKWLK